MERLARFALYLAIGIGLTLFVLVLFSVLPYIIADSGRQWDRLDTSEASKDEMYSEMTAHPAYVAMYEVHPDAKEEFRYHDRQDAVLEVGVMNYETQNTLILHLDYQSYADRVHARVHCNTGDYDRDTSADGLFTEDFIRSTKCLDAVGAANNTKHAEIGSTVMR